MKLGLITTRHPRPFSQTGLLSVLLAAALLTQAVSVAHGATSSGMPWDNSLNQIVSALTGSVAHVIGVVALFGLGAGMAFSEGGQMLRKGLWVVLGLTLAFNAATWGLTFLGLGAGLLV
jgi:type IV secretory pathway VirB2 component (pilin)